jgi:hypothetical protein
MSHLYDNLNLNSLTVALNRFLLGYQSDYIRR